MEPDTDALDESVVIAYGQQKKVTITGAVSAVSGEGLMKSPVPNVANALQGNLPGVSAVQPSGMPGADEPVIRIRGVGSLNSAEPLVLVDGVERSFSQLDANEIESISVLKDASATAVFGVRGANGVILVTTKRGTTGKASVTASANAAVQTISKFIDFADSYTYGQMWNYTAITDALPLNQWPGSRTINDYTPYADTGIRFSQDVMEHFRTGDMPRTFPSMDWIKYIMNDAAWQEQANVNVNGGTERVRYFVSAGFLNQDSLFKTFTGNKNETFSFQRLNYRANLDIDVSKRSQVSITLGGRMQNRNTMGGGEGFLFRYLQGATPYAGSGIDEQGRHIISDETIVGQFDRDALSNYYNLGYQNESTNVLNFDIQYKLDLGFITKGLDFKVKASYNSEYTARKNRQNGFGTGLTYVATIVDGQEVLRKENITWPLPYNESKWGSRNWYTEASFNYNRKFGQHNFGALLLYNQSKTYYPWDSDGSLYQSIPKGYVGLVGRLTYDYATKYLLDFNIGRNGSENFAPGKRYGTFPSVSIGWIPSMEPWWQPVSHVISYLKLRGSYGIVGNDNTNGARFLYLPGAWQFYTGATTVNPQKRGANFGTSGGWLQAVKELTAGNPNVTWETAQKINVGMDVTFFSKLHAYVDFFWEDRKDILVSNANTLSAVTSLPSSYVNQGRVKNHGFEVTLNWEDRIGNVHYNISPNVSFARNKVIEMLEVKPLRVLPARYRRALPGRLRQAHARPEHRPQVRRLRVCGPERRRHHRPERPAADRLHRQPGTHVLPEHRPPLQGTRLLHAVDRRRPREPHPERLLPRPVRFHQHLGPHPVGRRQLLDGRQPERHPAAYLVHQPRAQQPRFPGLDDQFPVRPPEERRTRLHLQQAQVHAVLQLHPDLRLRPEPPDLLHVRRQRPGSPGLRPRLRRALPDDPRRQHGRAS